MLSNSAAPPIRAIVFDRQSFDAWLAQQPPERAAEIREGLELVDQPRDLYLDLCIAIKPEEKP